MKFDLSDRGFKHYEAIPTDYGHEVRVYESSAAKGPHIWLALEGTAECEIHDDRERRMAAHLSLDQARAVRDSLDAAIRNHYQEATA